MKSEGLDWFAFTCTEDQRVAVEHVETNLEQNGCEVEFVGGARWYRERKVYKNGITICRYSTSRRGKPYLVEIPGQAFSENSELWEKVCVHLAPYVSVNRVDWRVDFVSSIGDYERVFWPEEFHGLKGQHVKTETAEKEEGDGYSGVRSGRTEFVLRYYDKKTETGGKLPNPGDSEWWRLEWVVRKVLCKSQGWYRVAKLEDIRGIMVGCLIRRFKVPVNFVGQVDALPRLRYHSDARARYARLAEKIQRDTLRLAEMEETIGCGGLLEF